MMAGTLAALPGRAEEPTALVQRVQSLLRAVGLEYEVSLDPALRGRSIPAGFLVVYEPELLGTRISTPLSACRCAMVCVHPGQ